MKRLSRKEEEIMHVLWRLGKAFVREIIVELPPPKPHYNTVSTIIRILQDKDVVGHENVGKGHRYFPLLSKEAYRQTHLKGILTDYFDNSYKGLVAHFAQEEKLTEADLLEIIAMIKKNEV